VSDVSDDAGDGLIDLSGLSLRDLDKLGDSSLLHELRRVLGPEEGEGEMFAGFNDSV
jgi:FXSXX-COOH protein